MNKSQIGDDFMHLNVPEIIPTKHNINYYQMHIEIYQSFFLICYTVLKH